MIAAVSGADLQACRGKDGFADKLDQKQGLLCIEYHKVAKIIR